MEDARRGGIQLLLPGLASTNMPFRCFVGQSSVSPSAPKPCHPRLDPQIKPAPWNPAATHAEAAAAFRHWRPDSPSF